MKFAPTNQSCFGGGEGGQPGRDADSTRVRTRRWGTGACAAFTLAEVLAALVFMAIVIPVAVEGLRIANLAGQVGQRKAVAARVGDSVLNELVATGQWQRGTQRGSVIEGPNEYVWETRIESSNLGSFRLLTVLVTYPVQGQDYDIRLSTLVNNTQ